MGSRRRSRYSRLPWTISKKVVTMTEFWSFPGFRMQPCQPLVVLLRAVWCWVRKFVALSLHVELIDCTSAVAATERDDSEPENSLQTF